jgi:hypothetical protein
MPPLLPLGDWRSLACPPHPDESFALLRIGADDPARLGAAAATQRTGPYPAFDGEGVVILPGASWLRTRLRSIQCPLTDPVSFALADGGRAALFPEVSGWSARDIARRAVAEHRAWLEAEPASRSGSVLGRLLTAARAALFMHSLSEGEAELSLTVTETARQVAARSSAERTVIEAALEHYREFALHGIAPPPDVVKATRRLVFELPAYAGANAVPARR